LSEKSEAIGLAFLFIEMSQNIVKKKSERNPLGDLLSLSGL
jgi:hypothetical protein